MNHKMKEKKNAPINKQQQEGSSAPVLKDSHNILFAGVFLRWKKFSFIIIFSKHGTKSFFIFFNELFFCFSFAFQKHEKNIIASHRFPSCDDVFFRLVHALCCSMHDTTQLLRWKKKIFWWYERKGTVRKWCCFITWKNWVRTGSCRNHCDMILVCDSFLCFPMSTHYLNVNFIFSSCWQANVQSNVFKQNRCGELFEWVSLLGTIKVFHWTWRGKRNHEFLWKAN